MDRWADTDPRPGSGRRPSRFARMPEGGGSADTGRLLPPRAARRGAARPRPATDPAAGRPLGRDRRQRQPEPLQRGPGRPLVGRHGQCRPHGGDRQVEDRRPAVVAEELPERPGSATTPGWAARPIAAWAMSPPRFATKSWAGARAVGPAVAPRPRHAGDGRVPRAATGHPASGVDRDLKRLRRPRRVSRAGRRPTAGRRSYRVPCLRPGTRPGRHGRGQNGSASARFGSSKS